MPKAVIKFVFEVYGMDCWRTYLTHAQICDNVRVQNTTEWIVFSPFSRFRVFVFSSFRAWRFRVFAFSRFRVPPAASPRPGHRFRVHSFMHVFIFSYIYIYVYTYFDLNTFLYTYVYMHKDIKIFPEIYLPATVDGHNPTHYFILVDISH